MGGEGLAWLTVGAAAVLGAPGVVATGAGGASAGARLGVQASVSATSRAARPGEPSGWLRRLGRRSQQAPPPGREPPAMSCAVQRIVGTSWLPNRETLPYEARWPSTQSRIKAFVS